MYDSIRDFLELQNNTAHFRNDLLRIGSVVLVIGFYLIATAWVLFDRVVRPVDPDENSDPPPEPPTPGPATALLRSALLLSLALAFPWLFTQNLHAWIIPAAFLVALATHRSNRFVSFRLSPPEPITPAEGVGLMLAGVAVLGLCFYRWDQAPPSMNGDVATITSSGMDLWRFHWHPIYLNRSTLPGLFDPIYGLAGLLIEDPHLAPRIFPAFCAVLCPFVLYRLARLWGSRLFAAAAVLVFVCSPFFQYYARVPMGTTLILYALIFLYGFFRSLIGTGWLAPVIGGMALGLAQWDYYASRILIGLAILFPFIALVYFRQLARGWWYRVIVLALVALPFYAALPLMSNFHAKEWTFYLTPSFFSVENSDIARDPDMWVQKLLTHWRMWFDPKWNEARFMTQPGTPVLPYPLSGLALVGVGVLVFSLTSPTALMLLVMFFLGMASSILFMGLPNGHRAMLSSIPALLFAAYGLWAVAPVPVREWMRPLRVILLSGLIVWGSLAGLVYFHGDFWSDPRTLRAEEYDENFRAERVNHWKPTHDIRIAPYPKDIDRYLVPGQELKVLNWGDWLPPSLSDRPLSVHGRMNVPNLMGLPESAFPSTAWRQFEDPSGAFAGWEYQTQGLGLGLTECARQWGEEGRIVGSLMFPASGTTQLSSRGVRFVVSTPEGEREFVESGEFESMRGLNRVTLYPTISDQPMPLYIDCVHDGGNGKELRKTLATADVLAVPVHGWRRVRREVHAGAPDHPNTFEAVTPVIFTHHLTEEVFTGPAVVQSTTYTAVAHLPSGTHSFFIDLNLERGIQLKVGDEVIFSGSPMQRLYSFSITGDRASGKVWTLSKRDDGSTAAVSLEYLRPNGRRDVPPYDWFTPPFLEPGTSDRPPWLRNLDTPGLE